jgi:hypothetical protein
MKILFHANDVEFRKTAIRADFAQFICTRRMILTSLDEPHRNNLFKFITGTGNALEKVRIFSTESNLTELCEFLVKVNFENNFYNFQFCDL